MIQIHSLQDISDYLPTSTTQYVLNGNSASRFKAFYTGGSLPVGDPISVGQPYQFNIVAFNATKNEQPWCCSADMQSSGQSMCIASRFCAQFSPSVNMYQLPGAPTGLVFVPFGNKILKASWTPPSYTGGQTDKPLDFEIQLDGAVIIVSNKTVYITPQFTEGTSHTIQVRAINYAGRGAWSAPVTNISLLLPSAPTALSAIITGEGIISTVFNLPLITGLDDSTWPIESYIMRVNIGQNSYLNVTIASNVYQASVTGLTKGVLYTFAVSAINWAGEGAVAQSSQVAMYRASAPTALSFNTTAYSEQLQVFWNLPADVGDGTNSSFRIFNYSVALYKPNTPACVYSTTGAELLTNAVRISQIITASKNITFEGLQPNYCLSVAVSANNAASNIGVLSIITAIPQLLNFRQVYANLSSNLTGAVLNVNITFITYSALRGADKIILILPPIFSFGNLVLNDVSVNGQSITGNFRVQSASSNVCGAQCSPTPALLITRVDGKSENPGSFFQVSIGGVQNPLAAGFVGTFQLKTLRGDSNFLIDASVDVSCTPSMIVPDRVDVLVMLSNPRAGASTFLAVDFSCAMTPIPPNAVLTLTLGDRLQELGSVITILTDSCPAASTGPWVSCTPPISGALSVSVLSTGELSIVRNGGYSIPAGQKVRFILGGIRNPPIPGSSGPFQVVLNNSAGMFAVNLIVDPVFIWPMSNYSLQPGSPLLSARGLFFTSYITGYDSIATLLFTASSLCAKDRDGSSIILELPESFQPISEPFVLLTTTPASQAYAVLLGTNRSERCIDADGGTCLGISKTQCSHWQHTWITCWLLTFQVWNCADLPTNAVFNLTFGLVRIGIYSGNVTFNVTIANNLWSANNVSVKTAILGQTIFGPVEIGPSQIVNPTVKAQSSLCSPTFCGLQVVNTEVPIIVSFTTSTQLPLNFSLVILFGSGSTYSAPGTLSVSSLFADGNWTIRNIPSGKDSSTLLVNRLGSSILPQNYFVSLNITGLRSGGISGSSGTYSVYVTAADGNVIAISTSVPAVYFKYPIPSLSQLFPFNGPTTGGISISFQGSGFGPVDMNPRLGSLQRQRVGFIGMSSCQTTTWSSDSSLSCLTYPGVSTAWSIAATIETQATSMQIATVMALFSFDAPSILKVSTLGQIPKSGANVPTSGRGVVLTGADYGICDYSSTIRVVSACSSSSWSSDSAVSCRVIEGFLQGLNIAITVGLTTGTLNNAISYDSPLIQSLTSNGKVSGGSAIGLTGLSLGFFDSSSRMRFGQTACKVSAWTSDTSMACMTNAGIEQNLAITLSVGNHQTVTMPVLWSYDLPAIYSYSASEQISSTLTLNGINFGIWDNTIQADISPFGCVSTSWVSDSSVLCALKPPLVKADLSDASLQTAIAQSYVCKNCGGLDGNFLLGCNLTSNRKPRTSDVGKCQICQSCPPGSNRVGCDSNSRLRYIFEHTGLIFDEISMNAENYVHFSQERLFACYWEQWCVFVMHRHRYTCVSEAIQDADGNMAGRM